MHYQGAILVAVFVQGVELSDSVVERLEKKSGKEKLVGAVGQGRKNRFSFILLAIAEFNESRYPRLNKMHCGPITNLRCMANSR